MILKIFKGVMTAISGLVSLGLFGLVYMGELKLSLLLFFGSIAFLHLLLVPVVLIFRVFGGEQLSFLKEGLNYKMIVKLITSLLLYSFLLALVYLGKTELSLLVFFASRIIELLVSRLFGLFKRTEAKDYENFKINIDFKPSTDDLKVATLALDPLEDQVLHAQGDILRNTVNDDWVDDFLNNKVPETSFDDFNACAIGNLAFIAMYADLETHKAKAKKILEDYKEFSKKQVTSELKKRKEEK